MAGKIIKGDSLPAAEPNDRFPGSPRPRATVVEADVYDAHQRAKEIIEKANADAERIRAEAESDRLKIYEKAKSEGHQAGLAAASEILAKAHRARGEMISLAEKQVVELALEIAHKIVGRELVQDKETIVSICAQAIENLRTQRDLVLRVHPEDAVALRENRKRLMDLIGRAKDLSVKEDPAIPRGGCIIESESGATIDARLETQLEMLRSAILEDGDGGEGFSKGGSKP